MSKIFNIFFWTWVVVGIFSFVGMFFVPENFVAIYALTVTTCLIGFIPILYLVGRIKE